MRERNQYRIWRLRDIRDELTIVASALARKPQDPEARRQLVDRAKVQVDKFLDLELWTWSDLAVKDRTWPPGTGTTVRAGTMTDPDFKSLPALDYHRTAVTVWLSALQLASNGDPAWIVAAHAPEMDRHIAFLTVRPAWDRLNGTPVSLPEHVQHRIRAQFVPDLRPTNGVCEVSEYVLDLMRGSTGSSRTSATTRRRRMRSATCRGPAARTCLRTRKTSWTGTTAPR